MSYLLLGTIAWIGGLGIGVWVAGEIVKRMVLDVFEVAKQQGAEVALMELERWTGFKRPRHVGSAESGEVHQNIGPGDLELDARLMPAEREKP